MNLSLSALLTATVLALSALSASAATAPSPSDVLEAKRTPPTFPCSSVRPPGPTGPKCLAKPCNPMPGPIGVPPTRPL